MNGSSRFSKSYTLTAVNAFGMPSELPFPMMTLADSLSVLVDSRIVVTMARVENQPAAYQAFLDCQVAIEDEHGIEIYTVGTIGDFCPFADYWSWSLRSLGEIVANGALGRLDFDIDEHRAHCDALIAAL